MTAMDTERATRWLVTGSGGMLGRRVVERLALLGQPVLALPRSHLNITDQAQVDDAVNAFMPDVVINAAAWTDVEGAERDPLGANAVNALGARNVAVACQRVGVHLIHVSTDYVFDGAQHGAYDEDDTALHPINEYGCSKRAGEHAIVTRMGTNYHILRTAWLYDVNGRNFYTSILNKLRLSDGDVHVVCDQWGHPTPVTRLAELIVYLGRDGCVTRRRHVPFGTYHATSTDATTWYAFAREIARVNGEDPKRIKSISTADLPESYRARRPRRVVLSQRKLRELDVCLFSTWQTELNLLVTKYG